MVFKNVNTFKMCMSFGVLMLLLNSWVAAESTMRYYVVEEGETLSGIAFSEVGDAEAWREIQKQNNVPNPKLLMPGTKLKIPENLYRTKQVTALVIRVNGQAVHLSSLGEKVRVLTKGDELAAGAIIETKGSSNVVLQFIDNSRFFISENSRISLETIKGDRAINSAKTIIKVEAGSTESRVESQQKGALYEVVTPEMRLAVRGTEFVVNVDKDTNTSRAMIMEGLVLASQKDLNSKNKVDLMQGTGFIATKNETGVTVKLLPEPKITPQEDPSNLSNWSAHWSSVNNANKYRSQLFTGKEYNLNVKDITDENEGVNFKSLDDGIYELRVRAIDKDEMEGLASSYKFEINAFPSPPSLKKTKAINTSNKKTVFKWDSEPEADYYHFQIYSADDSSSYFSKIEKIPANVNQVSFRLVQGEYLWRVASISEEDGQGPFSQSKKIEIKENN